MMKVNGKPGFLLHEQLNLSIEDHKLISDIVNQCHQLCDNSRELIDMTYAIGVMILNKKQMYYLGSIVSKLCDGMVISEKEFKEKVENG